jgi:hypothetical protein
MILGPQERGERRAKLSDVLIGHGVFPPGDPIILFPNLRCNASEQLDERAALYLSREHFRDYWAAERWLTLDIDGGEPCVRASHYVGLLPFQRGGQSHLLLIAPKGCEFDTPERPIGLLRFLEMVAIADGGEAEEDGEGLALEGAGENLLVLLAGHYGHLLHELCRRDFRRYFRPEEGELRGRVRGRVRMAAHLRNCLHGRAHLAPCCWEEFTPDNWDNRILLGAMRLVQRAAAGLAPQAVDFVRERFQGLDAWFSAVEEVPIRSADLEKGRLGRTSRHYRRTLQWARLIIRGLDRPAAGGQAPPLVLDANSAFEGFAKIVTRSAVDATGQYGWEVPVAKDTIPCLIRPQHQPRFPDVTIRDGKTVAAVGDAKYKVVLEQGLSASQLRDLDNDIVPKIGSADWNQLYVYMRMAGASRGFFVVPYWEPGEQACPARLVRDFEFAVPPLDRTEARSVRVAVLGLNLLQPLGTVRECAGQQLADWLRVT